jgi:hypothetical protein
LQPDDLRKHFLGIPRIEHRCAIEFHRRWPSPR